MRNRFITITILLFILVQNGYAQDYNLNPLSENWIGWSIGNSKRDFDIKVPVQEQVGGVTVSNDNSTVRTSSSSRTNRTIQRKHYTSPSAVNERINACRADMRARAKAREMRIEAENARDRNRGLHEYLYRTSGFHQANAARDAWMITEGTQFLKDNFHAEDMANPPIIEDKPQVLAMSGKDMAALLQSKKEKKQTTIEVTKLGILMKDRKFGDNGGKVNVTENNYLDEQQISKWSNAIDGEGLIDISYLGTKKDRKKPISILLVSHDELEIDSLSPFILPQYGLVSLVNDSLIILKDKELRSITWLKGAECSYVVTCGNKLIGKRGKALYEIKAKHSEKLLEFDTDEYSIFSGDNQSIFVVCWYGEISTIIKMDIDKKEYDEIVRLPLGVLTIAANDKLTLALVENDVFLIDDYGIPNKFFKTKEYINDIAMTEEGLLVATDNQIVIAKNAKEQNVFLQQGAKRLWSDGEDVYYQSMNNDLYLITTK